MLSNKQTLSRYKTLGVKVPISISAIDGLFDPTTTTLEKVKSQLYVLFFTSPKTRVMIPDFGVPIAEQLFENVDSSDIVLAELTKSIKDQVRKYVPDANIISVELEQTDNAVDLIVKFNLKQNTELEDSVVITAR